MALCKDLSFEECEIAILNSSVDKVTQRQGIELMSEEKTIQMIKIVENFLQKNDLLLYGGTAINAYLPASDKFYNYKYELPDYDAYSPTPIEHAKALADIYIQEGFRDVEAKAGVHHGTYKVFVNQQSIMDLTYLHPELYTTLLKKSKLTSGLYYVPPNFLRMSCYLELSRPMGDISRWEKVYKRLSKLNKYYPLVFTKCNVIPKRKKFSEEEILIYNTTLNALVKDDVVFIGAYANNIYTDKSNVPNVENMTEFDVISNDSEKTCSQLMAALKSKGLTPKMETHPPIGELIKEHYSISVNGEYLSFVYQPVGCHSYNVVMDKYNNKVKIGTIDTLFSYYLAFVYADREYFDPNRILCLCSVLFKVQQDHRITNKRPLRRFTIDCYGTQPTLADFRKERMDMLEKLEPGSSEYEEWFLKYIPRKHKKKTKKEKRSNKTTRKRLKKKD
jgi:hypothetical protein